MEDNGTASNNQMYHVVITSTSEDYQLGRPIMDEEDKEIVDPDNLDNDNLVSPSFMIASQLGNMNAGGDLETANYHCKNYVEVTNVTFKGETPNYTDQKIYDDWRLPTEAELMIIAKFQGVQNSAVDVVLVSNNYWGIDGNTGNIQVRTDGDTGTRVRCVRDVKPEQ